MSVDLTYDDDGRRNESSNEEKQDESSDDDSETFYLRKILQNFFSPLFTVRQDKLECFIRDPLLKGKAQYSWPPS